MAESGILTNVVRDEEREAQELARVVREWIVGGKGCELVHEWLRFNLSPVEQLSRQFWAKDLDPAIAEVLVADRRARNFINANLRHESSWGGWTGWAPENPVWRLAFLPLEKFDRLAKLVGVFCAQEAIAHTVEGATVRRLRNNVGNELVEFALLRAPYVKIPKPEPCIIRHWIKDPLREIMAAGCECITQAFSDRTPGMQLRISKKLSGVFPDGPVQTPLPYNAVAAECLDGLSREAGDLL